MKEQTSHSQIAQIKELFKEIDSVQSRALSQIRLIAERGQLDSGASGSEFSLDATVKIATLLIQRIVDLNSVVELKVQQLPGSLSTTSFLHESLDLYNGKVKHLRRKLKESQLAAHGKENAIIHQQRLQEYLPAKGSDDEPESLDARSSLFAGRSASREAQAHDKSKPIGEQVLTQNKNITSSLQQSKQLMAMSVMQTELNIDTLDQQSKDLTQLNDKLLDMESVLSKSKQIVKFIEKQDKHDKRRIYAAIGFLLLCSAWVLWRRVLKLPAKILLWTFFKMFGILHWASSINTRDFAPIESQVSYVSSITQNSVPHVPTSRDSNEFTSSVHTGQDTSLPRSAEKLLSEASTAQLSASFFKEDEFTTTQTTESSAGVVVQSIDPNSPVMTWKGALVEDVAALEHSSFCDEEEADSEQIEGIEAKVVIDEPGMDEIITKKPEFDSFDVTGNTDRTGKGEVKRTNPSIEKEQRTPPNEKAFEVARDAEEQFSGPQKYTRIEHLREEVIEPEHQVKEGEVHPEQVQFSDTMVDEHTMPKSASENGPEEVRAKPALSGKTDSMTGVQTHKETEGKSNDQEDQESAPEGVLHDDEAPSVKADTPISTATLSEEQRDSLESNDAWPHDEL
ncbi:hypothetical protein OY671_002093 [Metschnikowia pulcherrima]|nr:hypothetical protein OY671_002093 [Metschnikowia pulcherrima]